MFCKGIVLCCLLQLWWMSCLVRGEAVRPRVQDTMKAGLLPHWGHRCFLSSLGYSGWNYVCPISRNVKFIWPLFVLILSLLSSWLLFLVVLCGHSTELLMNISSNTLTLLPTINQILSCTAVSSVAECSKDVCIGWPEQGPAAGPLCWLAAIRKCAARLTTSKREHEAYLLGMLGQVASLHLFTLQAQSECKRKWMLNHCARQVTSISSEPDGCRSKFKAVLDWACTCLTSWIIAISKNDCYFVIDWRALLLLIKALR